MIRTIAYFGSVTTSLDVPAVAGTSETILNGHHIINDGSPNKLVGAYVGSATLNRARFHSPQLRRTYQSGLQIRPINVGLLPVSDPNFADYRRQPIFVQSREELQLEVFATGAENVYGVFFLSDGAMAVPQGSDQNPVMTIRATGATTVVAGAWTNCPLTFSDALPSGIYEVIGMEAIGTTCIAARIVSPDYNQWRGGCIGQATSGGKPYIHSNSGSGMGFVDGGFGVLSRFTTTGLPSVEFLCNAADTAQTVFLKCVKVG